MNQNDSSLRRIIQKCPEEQTQVKNDDKISSTNLIKKTVFFVPKISIKIQIENFNLRRKNKLWNGQIVFLGFKGTLKIEYWVALEETLRSVDELSKLTFVDTQLDIERLVLLSSLIQLIQPKELSLKFKQNEIDDHGLEAFLNDGLMDYLERRMKQFVVVSNPGIFKGHFLKNFKIRLANMSLANKFNFNFFKNKQYKSFGFIKIAKNLPNADELELEQKLIKNLQESYCFSLSFKNCFNNGNCQIFQYLIEQTYREDKLEQIESLDVSDCLLGAEDVLQKMCQRISTSKGLLSLRMAESRPTIFQEHLIQFLSGDRYQQLRLNQLDLRDLDGFNGKTEKNIKILTYNLISIQIRTLYLELTLKKDQNRQIGITQALMNRINDLRNSMKKDDQFIPKLNIQILYSYSYLTNNDQSSDNNSQFLTAVVLNEFSVCKEFTIQLLDKEVVKGYLDALDKLELNILLMKKLNPLYKDFLPKLCKIGMHYQFQRLQIDVKLMESFFRRLFFTKSTDLLQIISISLNEDSLISQIAQGLVQFFKSLNDNDQKDNKILFSLQHLRLKKSGFNISRQTDNFQLLFKNVVFSNHFKLISLTLIREFIEDNDWVEFLQLGEIFLLQIPFGQLWTLKYLTLYNLMGSLDLLKLIELLVFNDKLKLLEITVIRQNVLYVDESMKSLRQKAYQSIQPMSLQRLHLGKFRNDLCNGNFENEFNLNEFNAKDTDLEFKERQFCLYNNQRYKQKRIKSYPKNIDSNTLEEHNFKQLQTFQILIEVLVLHPMNKIIELLLDSSKIQQIFTIYQDQIIKQSQVGHKQLEYLKSIILVDFNDYTEEQWELIGDIFVYGKDTAISSIEFRHTIITTALSHGLKKSLIKKQNHQNNKMELGDLKALKFNECQFDDELFSLLFSKEQNGDQILHIKNCVGLDNAIEFFKQIYKSNKDQLLNLNLSLCELIVDDTEFSNDELFEWFFGTIILNQKTQKLQYLQMQRNNLNDSKINTLNVILQELKEYNQFQRQKNYFRLRKFNFDGNGKISYLKWKSFFDVLFTIYDVHESEEKVQQDQQEVQLSYLQEDKSNVRDQMCLKNAQLILKKRLSIPEKLIVYPNLYNMTPPIQLNRLELDLRYSTINDIQQQCFYSRILRTLVYFSGSQLRELSLHEVQLEWFLNSTELSFQSAAESFSIQLKGLELITINGGDEIQMKRLAELYIMNQQINLEALILSEADGNFYQNLTECIEESLILGKVCNLRTLRLTDIKSSLDIIQTLNFFKTVIFNKYVPLNILHLYTNYPEQNFDFHSDYTIFNSMYDHLVQQNQKCPLQSVYLFHKQSNNTLNHLLPLFMQGSLVKLNEFNFDMTKKEKEEYNQGDEEYDQGEQEYNQGDEHVLIDELQLSFINLCDEQALVNFTITVLSLCFERKLTLEEFKFLYYVRPKLKYIYLGKLSRSLEYPEQISEFLKSENLLINKKRKKPCRLRISFDDEINSESNLLMEYFLFAQAFNWSDIIISDFQILEFFTEKLSSINYIPQCEDLVNQLRQLTLRFGRGFEVFESGLKAIGDHFIYNERSNLDELIIYKDYVKIEELQNLTSNAQVFRNKIQDNKEQEKTKLKLKKFIITTTKSMEDEGANIICKDILFFEYITIESVNLEATNWNSAMSISQCNHAQAWLQFQKTHKREILSFSLKSADWSRNEQIQSQEAWSIMCDTFLFSDNAPLLKVLNLSKMAIKDEQVSYICKKADDFFRFKGKYYRSPLKTLNFSGNNSISDQGWKSISEKFIFSSCVDLEELNLIGIELDKQKCQVVYLFATKKAFQQKQKKLNLITLYCKSSTLKFQFANIMKPGANDQYYLYDCSIPQDFEDDIPRSLGQFTSLVNTALYHTKYFKQSKKWEKSLPISEFHLDIAGGLLRPLSKYFDKNNHQLGHFPIDIATCEELCTVFKYRDSVGDPYPYQLFFTSDACQFYSHASCKIRIINFIKTKINNAEKVNQFQVLELWEQIKSTKTSLDMVFMDYQFDDDLVDSMKQKGYTERDVVNLIRLFPPSSLILRVSLTLQALKGIYSIMYDDHQFNYAQILYDTDTSLNVGIGYSLRETIYKTNPTNFAARCIKSIMYHFFDFFVTPVSKYSINKEIGKLNLYLSNQGNYLVILTLLTIIYFVICLFSPYMWQHYYPPGDSDFESICSQGITDKALYFYLVFAFFSFIAEGFLCSKISKIIPEHILSLVQKDELNQSKTCQVRQSPQEEEQISLKSSLQILKQEQSLLKSNNHQDSLVNKDTQIKNQKSNCIRDFGWNCIWEFGKNCIMKLTILAQSKNGRILGYMIDLTLSQVAKLSLFTDVSFIMLTFYCKYQVVALLALISTGFNVSLQLYELLMFIVTHCFIQHKQKAKLLSTKYINDFYEISVLSRNIALSTILDITAPYNITVIPNNSLTRSLFPFYAGKSMSNSVRSYIVKFLFGDIPHIILQLYFVINFAYHPPKDSNDTGVAQPVVINPLLYVTILNTIRGLLFSFMRLNILIMIRLMQIRPSSISQEDFDDLIEQKQEEFMDSQINFIKQEQEIFEELTLNIHEYP